jgi:hypothetical protein
VAAVPGDVSPTPPKKKNILPSDLPLGRLAKAMGRLGYKRQELIGDERRMQSEEADNFLRFVGKSEEKSVCRVYSSASAYCPIAESCQDGNEYSGCIKVWILMAN